MRRLAVGLLILFMVIAILGCSGERQETPNAAQLEATTLVTGSKCTPVPELITPTPITTTWAPDPLLELVSIKGCIEQDYFRIYGQVENISLYSLKNVLVVVDLCLEDDRSVKVCEALLDLNPILPGETSEFSTLTLWNRPNGKFRIMSIKYLGGGNVPWQNNRIP